MGEWIDMKAATARALCGRQNIYQAVRAGQLRAARLGGRREFRFRPEWIDQWLEATAVAVNTSEPAPAVPAQTAA
jgi:excisionase family DNA binding protein